MKINNQVLGTQTYEMVKKMIINKQLAPGSKILQDKLAEDLGISRTPLRTALQILESENLVESIPRRGVYVKAFTDKDVCDIYDCRIALEGTAVRLFTSSCNPTDISFLKKLFSVFKLGKIDEKKYQIADHKFHAYIINNCGNEFLQKTINRSNMISNIDIIGLLRSPEDTLGEHIDIIVAIEKRDEILAESLMKNHLQKTQKLIQNKINA